MNLIRLEELLAADRVALLDSGESKQGVLRHLAKLVCQSVPHLEEEELLEVLLAREGIMSTGIGLGIAVPHARLKTIDTPVLAVGVSRDGIDYESLDDKPAHIVVLIVVPTEAQQYLRILARVTLLFKNAELRGRLLAAEDEAEIYEILSQH